MASAAKVVERRQDWAREYGLVSVLNEFGTNVIYELDYRNEAYNALRLGRNMESIERVEVPKILLTVLNQPCADHESRARR